MKSTDRIHFSYIVGILLVVIVILVSVQWGQVPQLVEYLTFALTLASLLLALLAIVYAFLTNTAATQHLGAIGHASDQVASAASDLARSTADLEDRLSIIPALISRVDDRVQATHAMVRSIQNAPTPPRSAPSDGEATVSVDRRVNEIIAITSPIGRLTMYALAVAYEKRCPISLYRWPLPMEDQGDYCNGWVMAMDAFDIIDVEIDKSQWTFHVRSYDESLRGHIVAAARDLATGAADADYRWATDSVAAIDEFFDAAADSSRTDPPG